MWAGDVGGPWTDLSTLGVIVNGRAGWLDSVQYTHRLVGIPGTVVSRHLGGDPEATRRRVIARGFVSAADVAALQVFKDSLNTLIAPSSLVEFYFSDRPLVVARGFGHVRYREIAPQFKLQGAGRHGSFVEFIFDCADPVRYDISGGQPGVAIDSVPALSAASLTAPLPS